MNLKVFPFYVAYAVEGELVWEFAVAHDGRRPGYWKNRLTEVGVKNTRTRRSALLSRRAWFRRLHFRNLRQQCIALTGVAAAAMAAHVRVVVAVV